MDNNLRLVLPDHICQSEYTAFVAELRERGERLTPYSLDCKDLNFTDYIRSLNDEAAGRSPVPGWVPATTFFLVDRAGVILGAVNIRHRLTDSLLLDGGHIGYCIRPSARNKGLGKLILKLALQQAEKLGVRRVLLTCDEKNLQSAAVICYHGGALDSSVDLGDRIVQRYWIRPE